MKKIVYYILITFVTIFSFSWVTYSVSVDDSVTDMELLKYYGVVPLLLNIHMEIWMWESDNQVMNSYSSLLQNMKYYADIDIIQYLKQSINPESSLNNVLNKMWNVLNTANAFIVYLDNLKTDQAQNKSRCDDIKETVDKNFSLALKDFDAAKMERYISMSIENEKCSVEARIMYNVYDKMWSQVKYYYNILQNKYDYFFSNKYDIVQLMNN